MYSFNSRVRFSESGSDKKITLDGILNYFQDCSTFHTEDLGIGMDYLEKNHGVWVLSAWQIVVNRYPRIGEQIKISTWPYAFRAFLGSRNFTMEDEKGEVVAYANSIWTYMNTEKGRPYKMPQDMMEKFVLEEPFDMEYADRKIEVTGEGEVLAPFPIHKSQIDTNHHVNNGEYVRMAKEYLPQGYSIKQMRAEYCKQALYGNEIIPILYKDNGKITVVLAENTDERKPYAIVEFGGK